MSGSIANVESRKLKVVVSSLFFFREDLAAQFVHTLVPQLAHAAQSTGAEVQLVVSLNYPFTSELWGQCLSWAATFRHDGVSCELVRRGFNLGFGAAHNHVFRTFPADVFVVINNDLFCERNDWLTAMVRRLGPDGEADVVGADENRASLREADACGEPSPDPARTDYLDGSLLGLRAATARRLGLFAEDNCFLYFEDSDLILRYRQAGARIETIPIPHRHLRSASSRLLPRSVVSNVMDINRAAFFAKWSGYLQRRTFVGRGCADLRALRPAECLDAIPALLVLARSHPGARLELRLPDGAPTEWFWHPQWDLATAAGAETPEHFDRIWVAERVSPREDLPPPLVHVRGLGSGFPGADAAEYLELTARRLAPGPTPQPDASPQALIALPSHSAQLQGVIPTVDFFLPAAERLRSRGYSVLWAGTADAKIPDGTGEVRAIANWAEWLGVLTRAALVISPAGTVLTLAQYLSRPTFAVCGSILPDRAIWAWTTTDVYAAPNLECLGCHHLWGQDDRAFCLRRDERCIHPGFGVEFADRLAHFLECGPSPLASALMAAQRARVVSYRPSPFAELLGRWPDDPTTSSAAESPP